MPPVLLSAGIRASALQMSKFRGSITFPIFSLSTLSRQHYCNPPKTRYCWLVRPSQTGFSPDRLPALRLGAQSRFAVALLYIRFSENESGLQLHCYNSKDILIYCFLIIISMLRSFIFGLEQCDAGDLSFAFYLRIFTVYKHLIWHIHTYLSKLPFQFHLSKNIHSF